MNVTDSRYSRHLMLPGFGAEGQERLTRSSVLIVGAGGLGSPIALYLAAAGVGRIGVCDGDEVSLSNLQRQVIHFTEDVGCNKAESATGKMRRLNPEVEVVCYPFFLSDENADRLLAQYDFIVEASDNFQSRYRISDTCVRLGKAYCMGGISHYEGQVMTHVPGTSTYRDLYPTPGEQTAEPLPVLGPAVGMLGTIMATETVKYLAGVGELLTDRLLTFDALAMQFSTFGIKNKEPK